MASRKVGKEKTLGQKLPILQCLFWGKVWNSTEQSRGFFFFFPFVHFFYHISFLCHLSFCQSEHLLSECLLSECLPIWVSAVWVSAKLKISVIKGMRWDDEMKLTTKKNNKSLHCGFCVSRETSYDQISLIGFRKNHKLSVYSKTGDDKFCCCMIFWTFISFLTSCEILWFHVVWFSFLSARL